jgi:hypothetical protein
MSVFPSLPLSQYLSADARHLHQNRLKALPPVDAMKQSDKALRSDAATPAPSPKVTLAFKPMMCADFCSPPACATSVLPGDPRHARRTVSVPV